MAGRRVRLLRRVLIAAAVAIASTLGIAAAWRAIGGGALPLHGWIALSLGVAGTIAITWSLMALAFRSSREGWDARAGETPPSAADHDKP